jgi:cytoskeletal protein CcmA (bactofilin family)
MKKYAHVFVCLLVVAALAVIFVTAPAEAVQVMGGDMVEVPEGQIIGPLFASGNDVTVDADVDGDVFAVGQTVTINGNINGDLLAAARTIRVYGVVQGNVRCAAEDVEIKGEVGQCLTAAARNVRQFEGSSVNRDALLFGGSVALSGIVGRQALGACENVRLNGPVGGDIHFWSVGELQVGPEADIKGNLFYASTREADIASEASIAGSAKWERIIPARSESTRAGINWWAQLIWFASGVILWLVFSLIFPRLWSGFSQNITRTPWPTLGWGFLLLLLVPLAVLLLLVTVIGIPLAIILTMVYALLLYAGKIVAGDAISSILAGRLRWEGWAYNILAFMISFAALILLSKIPVLGFLVNVVAACLALGAVFLAICAWRLNPPAGDLNE